METLSFTTPAKTRTEQVVPVVFCGEDFEVRRPKDAVLYFVQTVIGDSVGEGDRAMAVLQFIEAALSPSDRKRFFDRCLDGPRGPEHPGDLVNQRAVFDLIGGLLDRWNNWPATGPHSPDPVVVEPTTSAVIGEPITIEHEELDLNVVAWPPKDIIVLFVGASLATGANLGQQAWAIGLFLDAALNKQDELVVSHRLRNTDDDLDLEHLAEMVKELIEHWTPRGNRAERRAAARAARTLDVD